jgi:hypothetical protein
MRGREEEFAPLKQVYTTPKQSPVLTGSLSPALGAYANLYTPFEYQHAYGETMKIAILGWGSLLWEGGEQFENQHDAWQYDGPSLKLEFSRISSSRLGALTLVIDPKHGSPTTVAWCLSKRSDPLDTMCDLSCRESTTLRNIGRVFPSSMRRNLSHEKGSRKAVVSWARTKHLDVVVWTDLQSNFNDKRGVPFSIQESLSYLQTLTPEAKAKSAEYIWRAPDFVQTPLRVALQQEPWFIKLGA